MFKMKSQATRSQTWGRETVRQGVKDRAPLERQGVKFHETKRKQKTADAHLDGRSRGGAMCVVRIKFKIR